MLQLSCPKMVGQFPCLMSDYLLQGTGTFDEMAIAERDALSKEGIVIASVEVMRSPPRPSAQVH